MLLLCPNGHGIQKDGEFCEYCGGKLMHGDEPEAGHKVVKDMDPCPSCKYQLRHGHQSFCPGCGVKLKWECR
jgi:hypothetical protein